MKARAEAAELNLDSLMDTVTNVVGILVLILVLVTLNIKKTVERLWEEDPSQFGVSREQLAEIQQKAEKLRDLVEQLQIQTVDLDVQLEQDQTKIVEHEKKLEEILRDDPEQALEKLLDDRKEKEEELAKTEKEIEAVQGELGNTPEMTAPPPKIVRLPNPREAPQGAQPVQFICRAGRLIVFDPEELKDRVLKRVLYLMRPLAAKAGPEGEIDCEQLVGSYNQKPMSSDEFQTRLVVENYNLVLIYEYKEGGETLDRVRESASRFQVAVRRMDPQKLYARFLVWPDSFDVYVEARSIVDARGVLAGWEPYTEDYQWKISLGLPVKCQGKPKPPPKPPSDPTAPKPPTTPPPPPLPNDVVD